MLKTIILIDDDEDDLEIMKEAISQIDPSTIVLSFITPDQATQAITSELIVAPDFIFIDINMTPYSGDHCLKELRKNPLLDDTIIAMFSTFLPPATATELFASGANYAFEKPGRFEDYLNVIRQVLETGQPPD